MISNRIKNLIFEFLLKDLTKVEIIYYRDSIWFIDRENRYWYFEYHKVDKHLWWRWSHFTTALTMFSMEAEKEQYLLGELVNMILTKKQKLETKYPNKIFKTVGSVLNFEDKVEEVLNCEIDTTQIGIEFPFYRVDDALNCEVETTRHSRTPARRRVDEVLNCEVETTQVHLHEHRIQVDEVLNNEVKTTTRSREYSTTSVDKVLNFDSVLISHGELIEEDKMMEDILSVEINSIGKLKGENPFQDIVVSHILDESEKVTDKLVIKEDEYVKTYSHDVYMCDHLVQNVLDVGVNSIHYDTHHHQPLVDGILKKA